MVTAQFPGAGICHAAFGADGGPGFWVAGNIILHPVGGSKEQLVIVSVSANRKSQLGSVFSICWKKSSSLVHTEGGTIPETSHTPRLISNPRAQPLHKESGAQRCVWMAEVLALGSSRSA